MPITDFTANVYRAGGYRSSNSHYSIPGRDYVPSRDNKYQEGTQEWLEQEFAKSGLPKSYYNQFMNNSFYKDYLALGSNHGINSILHSIGFRTGLDKDRLDLLAKAREYTQGLLDTYRKEQYDNPINASARENAAGLNSAMLGIDQAGSTPSMPEDTDPFSPNDEIASPDQFLTGATNPITSVMSQIFQLRQLSLANRTAKAGLTSSIVDIATDAAYDSVTSDSFRSYASDPDKFLHGSTITGGSLANLYGFHSIGDVSTFNTAYNRALRSIYTESDSYDAFSKINENRLKNKVVDADIEEGASVTLRSYLGKKAAVDRKYADWELELMDASSDDESFKKLWFDDRFAGIRESVQSSLASEAADTYNEELWNSMFDNQVFSYEMKEARDRFITACKSYVSERKQAEVDALGSDAVLDFLSGMNASDVAAARGISMKEARRYIRTGRRGFRRQYGSSAFQSWVPFINEGVSSGTSFGTKFMPSKVAKVK